MGYNAYNRGTKNGEIVSPDRAENLTGLTVGKLMRRQALRSGGKSRLFAIGKYQMIPSRMADAVRTLGIDKDAKFTAELQERIFRDYLLGQRRREVKNFFTAKRGSARDAVRAMAREWVSIFDPDTGNSMYGDGNVATINGNKL